MTPPWRPETMADAGVIETFDQLLNINMATTLAGLALISFALLISRVKDMEQESILVRGKKAGTAAYRAAIEKDMERMRLGARLLIIAAVACFASAVLMLVAFDTFLEVDLSDPEAPAGARSMALMDVWLTGLTFLFGLGSLLLGSIILSLEWLQGTRGD